MYFFNEKRSPMKRYKLFSQKFTLIIILLICLSFIVSNFFMYKSVHEKSINELHFTMNTLVEMLEDRLLSIDKIYLLLEEQLEKDIEKVLEDVNNTYEDLGHINFDFESFLIDDENSDLYIINNENQI